MSDAMHMGICVIVGIVVGMGAGGVATIACAIILDRWWR